MNAPHVIRIRGPWKRCVLNDVRNPATATVKIPSSWKLDLGDDFEGRVVYERFFNRPTNLDANSQVRLTFKEIVGNAAVELNGIELGQVRWPDGTASFDVSEKLLSRNQIVVEIESLKRSNSENASHSLPPEGGITGDVQLEID